MKYTRYLIVALAGLAVVVLAPALGGKAPHAEGLLAWYRLGVEEFSKLTLVGLFLLGLAAGRAWPESPKRLGMSSVLIFPLWAVVEILLDPTSHNLWPFEFAIYGFWGFVCALGTTLGSRLR